MAEKGGANYGVIVAVVAVAISLGNSFWSIANPREDLKDLKADIVAAKADLVKFRDEVRWGYTNKEENKTYRDGLEKIIARIEAKANALDASVHAAYSPKDAFATLQGRIADFERSLRDLIAKTAATAARPNVEINPTVNTK